MDKEALVALVIEQILSDIVDGDMSPIEELLLNLPTHILIGYLPDE